MPGLAGSRILSFLNFKATSLNHIKETHGLLITTGLKNPSILGKLIQHYCALSPRSTSNYAHLILNHQEDENPFLLNTLIRCSRPRDSILLFANRFSKSNVVFDDRTYIFALGACARSEAISALYEGKQLHACIIRNGMASNPLVSTTAMYFYASNGQIDLARQVFDEMPMRSSATWNALMTGYCYQRGSSNENAREALMLFKDMLLDVCGVEPTDTTMVCILSAASQLGELEIGTCVHGYVEKTIDVPENDVYIGTGLVDMYSKCGCLSSALAVFYRMKEKNVLTWTAMTTGLAFHGKGKEALEMLDQMQGHNVMPNVVTFTSLFSACCHAGLVAEGLHLFRSMGRKFGVEPHIRHYGCIIDLLGRAGHLREAYETMMRMPVKPDPILWRSLLSACKLHGDVGMGEKVAKVLLQLQPVSRQVSARAPSEDYIALSNVYASAGRWDNVEMVREEMKVKGTGTKPACSAVKSLLDSLYSSNQRPGRKN
ncbi:hypothetical protein Nepgr_001449 [Nepenthes gracilis]|uniref:Pentatricopeptide repeat-containing protein n=1 Tax=Nepenthes gracilis TaxID=150966 RepID=A0AAD3P2Q1_NEPGR|nr:hypothetical protein Nepgr_001449 [Nepenthes gracilis]